MENPDYYVVYSYKLFGERQEKRVAFRDYDKALFFANHKVDEGHTPVRILDGITLEDLDIFL